MVSDDTYLDQSKGGFEPDMVRLFESLVTPGDHVLDVGANVGCTALLFSDLAREVRAFEPSPTTYGFLDRNVRAAKKSNVRTFAYGLGAKRETSELTFSPDNRSGGFVSNLTKASVGHTTETIRIETLDESFAELGIPRVDFMKIDVEGFEKSVLEGGRETILRDRPIVVLELNHWCLNAFQRTSVPDFLDFLRSIFPQLWAVDGTQAANLHDVSQNYHVMYNHIIHFRFANLVGAFDAERLRSFFSAYSH